MTSLAQTYILASKVRSKLTKEAVNPNTDLRKLVTQANLLDNLMDNLARGATTVMPRQKTVVERDATGKVTFMLPEQERHVVTTTTITEAEIESSDDEEEEEEMYISGSSSEDESDYYISDSEEEYEYTYVHSSPYAPRMMDTIDEVEELAPTTEEELINMKRASYRSLPSLETLVMEEDDYDEEDLSYDSASDSEIDEADITELSKLTPRLTYTSSSSDEEIFSDEDHVSHSYQQIDSASYEVDKNTPSLFSHSILGLDMQISV